MKPKRVTLGLCAVVFALIIVGCGQKKPAPIDPHSPAGVNLAMQALQLPLSEALKKNDLPFIHNQMDYIQRLAVNLPYGLQGEKKQRVDDLLLKLKRIADDTDNAAGRKKPEETAANLEKLFAVFKELDAEFATTVRQK